MGQAELSPALCWVEDFVGRCSISSLCLLKQAGFQCRKLEICCQHYRTPFSLPVFHVHPTSCSQTRVPREGDGWPAASSQQSAASSPPAVLVINLQPLGAALPPLPTLSRMCPSDELCLVLLTASFLGRPRWPSVTQQPWFKEMNPTISS